MVAVLAPQPTPTTASNRPVLHLVPAPTGAGRAARSQSVVVAPRVRASAATYWRRRFVVLLMITTLALAVHASLSSVGGSSEELSVATGPVAVAAASDQSAGPAPSSGEVYVVRPGDTMWSIASSLQPDGDVRSLVDELTARAGGASLQAGQRIAIDGLGR